MKQVKSIISSLTITALITGVALNFNACSEETPLQANHSNSVSLAKESIYPQSASGMFDYILSQGIYEGGSINVPNGSFFKIVKGALTPPLETPLGESVTISMLVEYDALNNELLFSFGPSGCQFDPPAEVWFDWEDLGSDNATLYYIDEDGNYIPQDPDDVDTQGKRLKLYIDHFSRYAIGTE